MKKLSDTFLADEEAMRAFYEMCGISKDTIEAAIKMRRDHPVELEREAFRQRMVRLKKGSLQRRSNG
jgi:hypothetical protein